MRIAFIADGRAEHTRRWLQYFSSTGEKVMLLSTYPCDDSLPGVQIRVLPRLLSPGNALVKRSEAVAFIGRDGLQLRLMHSGIYGRIWSAWHQATTLETPLQAAAARRFLKGFQPDLVHAFRIQNEGYVAALTGWHPWILSVWGQDFVFFAQDSLLHRYLTRWTVRKPDALTADCARDIRLAREFGLSQDSPTAFFPSNGGVDLSTFRAGIQARDRQQLVLYPRGLAPYLRITTLLRAIKLVSKTSREQTPRFLMLAPPTVVPVMAAMARREGLEDGLVEVGPFKSRHELAALLGKAAISVSPSTSDGTPNSMLEAMACGAFPVVGNIESVREWIDHGKNGLLFAPEDPEDLASCLVEALDNTEMRRNAQETNLALVRERADYRRVMPKVREFYASVGKGTAC